MHSNAPAKLTKTPAALISQIVGSQPPLMPGESADQYQEALRALIDELGASTPMQIYLAQRMLDCLWDARNYDAAIRTIVANKMLEILMPSGILPERARLDRRALIFAGAWDEEGLRQALQNKGHTPQSLHAEALALCGPRLQHLHQLSGMIQDELEWEQLRGQRVSKRELAQAASMQREMRQAVLDLDNRSRARRQQELRGSLRYLRRSVNQLVKALRSVAARP